jgi:hypothetical protein
LLFLILGLGATWMGFCAVARGKACDANLRNARLLARSRKKDDCSAACDNRTARLCRHVLQVLQQEIERNNGKFETTMAKGLFKHNGVDLSASWKVQSSPMKASVVFL